MRDQGHVWRGSSCHVHSSASSTRMVDEPCDHPCWFLDDFLVPSILLPARHSGDLPPLSAPRLSLPLPGDWVDALGGFGLLLQALSLGCFICLSGIGKLQPCSS